MTGEPHFVTKFLAYNGHGQVLAAEMPNGLAMAYTYADARSAAVGTIPIGTPDMRPATRMVIEMLRGMTRARVLAAPYMIQPMPNSAKLVPRLP